MNRKLAAIRDEYHTEAIRLVKNRLRINPDDISSHFTLAQSYESTGDHQSALEHAVNCADALPDSFEALSLAARCAAKVEKYDDAHRYAEKALTDDKNPDLPRATQILFHILSFIPGLKALRMINEPVVSAYAKQAQWLRDYVVWYEQCLPNNDRQPPQQQQQRNRIREQTFLTSRKYRSLTPPFPLDPAPCIPGVSAR